MINMKMLLALVALSAAPAAALAQDANPFYVDLAGTRTAAEVQVQDPPAHGRERRVVHAEDEWDSPRMQFLLGIDARIDFPGGGDVTVFGDSYGDILDIGYGVNVEASLITWVHSHWGVGGFLSVGWDRYEGTSNFELPTGEVFSFDTWDHTTVLVGGKVVERVSPFIYWEGRIGVGIVHMGEMTFTDETVAPFDHGLQFFRPVTRGVFDFGGKASFGTPRITFDLGLDFRFTGPAARGSDVTNVVDPEAFFSFALSLGLSLRF